MEKIKKTLFVIFCFFYDCYGFIRSMYLSLFTGIKKPHIFFGYNSFWFAKHYANKRASKWPKEWDQLGKMQGVMPYNDESLIVCSKLELKYWKKRKVLNNKFNHKRAMKKSYYKATA